LLNLRLLVAHDETGGKSAMADQTSRFPDHRCRFLGYESISPPGLSKACGSIMALAALRAAANKGGRWRSYHRRWSRPTA
jgi:hypothetical protein